MSFLYNNFKYSINPVVGGALIAYASIILALAAVTALAAAQLIVVAQNWIAALTVSISLLVAGAFAAQYSGLGGTELVSGSAISIFFVIIGFYSAPKVLEYGQKIAAMDEKTKVTSLIALRALLEGAPKVCLILTVGVFLVVGYEVLEPDFLQLSFIFRMA